MNYKTDCEEQEHLKAKEERNRKFQAFLDSRKDLKIDNTDWDQKKVCDELWEM